MTQRIKKIFFITLTVLFLITSLGVVFYSLGWRFDWRAKKITQPGIFYFKVLPKNAQIYINGKLKKKTDFFFGSALIDNILPRKYDVEIKKQGFYSWQKTLEIKKRQVTESKNIILIPKNQKFTEISKNIENAFFSPNHKKIILEETAAVVPDNPSQIVDKNWSLKLFEADKNLKSQLIKERDISKEKSRLISLKFSPDGSKALLEIETDSGSKRETQKQGVFSGVKEHIAYYLLEINKIPAVLTPLNFSEQEIEEIYFNPQDPKKLFILSRPPAKNNGQGKELKEISLDGKKIILPSQKGVVACSIFYNNIYYLDKFGFIYETDLSFRNKKKLNLTPLSLKEKKYKITVSRSRLVLKEGDALYLLGKNKHLQKISDSVKGFKFSSDSKKLAYFGGHEIWILFLEKKYDQPAKDKGERLFLTRFSEKIGELFWYTNNYLIFDAGSKIKIAETDDRDKINIVELTGFESLGSGNTPQKEAALGKIFWNQRNSKLYVLSKGNLFSSEKLLP
jgi:hypothetical protein